MGCASSKSVKTKGTENTKDTRQNGTKNKEKNIKDTPGSHSSATENKNNEKTKSSETDYTAIDSHARKAKTSLKSSPQKLVEYLMEASMEPRMIARAIFVWITENIRYDVDGFFGKAPNAPTDAQGVMECGKSVCQGFANVMETLCREASIPVKLISGYAKGYGSSAGDTITTDMDTNHAWNAVQLDGQWYLVDCTWGAGHLDSSNCGVKEFNEFYFLTKPEQFISSHFPYMNKNMEESMKWQLLKNPVTLEDFCKNVKAEPFAFELDITPVSHTQGLVHVDTEEVFVFRTNSSLDIDLTTRLMHLQGNMLHKQPRSVFAKKDQRLHKLTIHPNKTGTFEFTIFGRDNTFQDNKYNALFVYTVNCTKIDDRNFEFPVTYGSSSQCTLLKPMQYKLKANINVEFHIISPSLKRVMINKTFLEKSGTSFRGTVKTGHNDETMSVYGSTDPERGKSLNGLYQYMII